MSVQASAGVAVRLNAINIVYVAHEHYNNADFYTRAVNI